MRVVERRRHQAISKIISQIVNERKYTTAYSPDDLPKLMVHYLEKDQLEYARDEA